MKQRILAAAMATAIALTMAGCSSGNPESDSSSTANNIAEPNYSRGISDTGFFEDVELLDYVTLPDGYMNFEFANEDIAPTEEDVESYIADIESNIGEKNEIEGAVAEEGSNVSIAFNGTIDGVAFNGGSSESTDLKVGAGQYFEEFEQSIIGHAVGDTFTAEVTFPEGYGSTTDADGNELLLDGKTAEFEIELLSVFEYELTDEAVETYFTNINETLPDEEQVTTVDGMKAYVEDMLKKQNLEQAVADRLEEESVISEVPQKLIDDYVATEWEYIEYTTQLLGYDDSTELLTMNGFEGKEDYEEYLLENADTYLRQQMLFLAVAEKEGIEYSAESCEAIFGGTAEEWESSYGTGYIAQSTICSLALEAMVDGAIVK